MGKAKENRGLILLGTVIAQLGLGTIYSWSLFNQPLVNKFGWNLNRVALTFSIASLALSISTLFTGKLQEKFGIKKVVCFCGILFGVGLILTSFANTLALLYIFAGIMVGIADGIAYMMTLSNIILGGLSDKVGNLKVLSFDFIVTAVAVFVLLFVNLNFGIFFAYVAAIAFCFGGNITIFPSLVGDFFGLKNHNKNYGVIYQGFGLGAFSGSIIANIVGGFKPTFMVIGVLCIISLIIVLTVKAPHHKGDTKNIKGKVALNM